MAVGLLTMSVLAFNSDTDVTYAVEGGNIYFDAATGTITYCDASVTAANIPSEINGVSVTNISDTAFGFIRVSEFEIHEGTEITSIAIPDSVISIAEYAFDGCDKLTNITVDSNNSNYKSVDGVLFDKNGENLMLYPAGKQGASYVVPDGVGSIGAHAFYLCFGLTAIAIPDSVASIGEEVFWDCRDMKDVYYSGSQEEWEKVSIESGNENLTNATIHYNSSGAEIMAPTPTPAPEPEPSPMPEPEMPEQAPTPEPPAESTAPAEADGAGQATAGSGHWWVYVVVGALLLLGIVVLLLKAGARKRKNRKG